MSQSCILTVNTGSSSIKASIYDATGDLALLSRFAIDNIGQGQAVVVTSHANGQAVDKKEYGKLEHPEATDKFFEWLDDQPDSQSLVAIGHRIVHGGHHYNEPRRIEEDVMSNLRALVAFDNEHMPFALRLIERLGLKYPGLAQVACFDTGFYNSMPRIAQILPLPREYEKRGLKRYGFHGLSYCYLMGELNKHDEKLANSRLILAHLGSGASLTAVKAGQPIDTTMSFTPVSGIMMSSRSGDLDPGVSLFLSNQVSMTPEEFNDMVNHKSGLLGVSETSANMLTLLEAEGSDVRAYEAVSLFCYQAAKAIGGLSAAMGGLDGIVFAGGIGEKAPRIRYRICENLKFLGVEIDGSRNDNNELVVSSEASKVKVMAMHTDEEIIIASQTKSTIGFGG